MRRFAFATSAVLAFAVLANPVDAQLLKFGGHVAMISGLEDAQALQGEFGFGARIGVQLPALPIGAFVSATYYMPDCDDCTYWTGSAFAKVGLPLPIVSPYVLGGIQRRALEVGGLDAAENGYFAGLGVGLGALFLEATMEFDRDTPTTLLDFQDNPIVFKGGVTVG